MARICAVMANMWRGKDTPVIPEETFMPKKADADNNANVIKLDSPDASDQLIAFALSHGAKKKRLN